MGVHPSWSDHEPTVNHLLGVGSYAGGDSHNGGQIWDLIGLQGILALKPLHYGVLIVILGFRLRTLALARRPHPGSNALMAGLLRNDLLR